MNDQMLIYNSLDSACTLEARNAFWDELKGGYEPAYDMTLRLYQPLMYMMTRGIKVGHDELEQTKIEVKKSEYEKQSELTKLCGRELNVSSPKDCQKYFYVEKGYPPYINRKTGSVSTDDTAMQKLVRGTATRPSCREAKLVQEIRSLRKLFGTYYDLEFDDDSRLRCSYNPRGTRFGRLSSSATVFGTGTNLQNLPPEFKRFLMADTGRFFWELDKRQAEWVVVAYLSGDANMISVIESGKDPHLHTAHLMFQCDEELVSMESKLIGSSTDQEWIQHMREDSSLWTYLSKMPFIPRSMSMRQCGKKSNHGLNYDEGYRTFALLNEMGEGESKVVVAKYHHIYPGIRQWHRHIQQQLARDRTLINCFGRRYRFMDGYGDTLYKSAYSFLPQSTVVDGLNMGLCSMYESTDSDMEVNEPLAQTHDSILSQFPCDRLHVFEKVRDMAYDMVTPEMEYNSRKFKIATDMKVGFNWGGYHKDANPLGMREVKNVQEIGSFLNGEGTK